MARQKTIVGLDIGSSSIRLAVAQQKSESESFQILGVAQVKSQGIRRGAAVDFEETIKNVKEAVLIAERTSGMPVDNVIVNLGGSHLSCRPSKGVIAVSRADGEISREDMERALSAAAAVSLGPNREILQIIPRRFSVDNETGIKDPIGMSGVRLEVDALIIDVSSPFIKNVNKILGEARLDSDILIPSPLAAARAVLDKRQKELGVLVLDMGGGTTGFTVYEEGNVVDVCILPIGSSHITNDLAIGLRTSIDVAEKIKLEYGSVLYDEINKRETIDLEKMGGEPGQILRREVAEIIEARVVEILDMAYKRLRQIDRAGLLPSGVVLVGGGAKLPGLVDLTKQRLRLPAQIGFPIQFEGVVEQIDDPCFATVLGLILWAGDQGQDLRIRKNKMFKMPAMPSFLGQFKNWLKSFLP